jgi:hypothetical protein
MMSVRAQNSSWHRSRICAEKALTVAVRCFAGQARTTAMSRLRTPVPSGCRKQQTAVGRYQP